MPGSQFEKMVVISLIICFSNLAVSSNILTSVFESWCIVFMGNLFFWDRIIVKKVNEPFISKQYIANFSTKTFYLQILVFHPYKQTTEYKQESLSAGRWRLVFLTVITAGKNSACQSINKSTE